MTKREAIRALLACMDRNGTPAKLEAEDAVTLTVPSRVLMAFMRHEKNDHAAAHDRKVKRESRARRDGFRVAGLCTDCEGAGWLLIDSGARGPEIQRCDTCQKYRTDEDAREAAGKAADHAD